MGERGRFIVLDGVDGSGKDTLLKDLILFFFEDHPSRFNEQKYNSFAVTYEPTFSSSEGRRIHKGANALALIPFSEFKSDELAMLYIKDRIKHTRLIREILESHIHVLCSRFDLSTYAYQGMMGSQFEDLYRRHAYGERNGVCLLPDLTIFLDISHETAIERISQKDNHHKDNYDLDVTQNALKKTISIYREAFENLQKKQPHRKMVCIDANQSKEEVLGRCVREIQALFA